jgi:hypothetical protein
VEPILGPVDDIKIGRGRLAATAAENGDVEKLCSANDGNKRWQCYEQYPATVVTRDIPSSSCSLVHSCTIGWEAGTSSHSHSSQFDVAIDAYDRATLTRDKQSGPSNPLRLPS